MKLGRLGFVMSALGLLALTGCVDDAVPRADPVPPACNEDPNCKFRLVIEGGDVLRMPYTESAELRLLYTDDQGAPLPGFQVNFQPAGDPKGSFISAFQTTTGADGRASISVTAGSENAEFHVQASAYRADSVSFRISVRTKGTGDLRVRVAHGGVRPLSGATVYVFSSPQDCAALDPSLGQPLPTALKTATLDNLGRAADFVVADAAPVAVYAVGLGDTPNTAVAWGCHPDPVQVNGTSRTELTVTLQDLPPRYIGTYDLVSNYDLVEALRGGEGAGGTAAAVIDELGRLFSEPGTTVLNWLKDFGGLSVLPDSAVPVLGAVLDTTFFELAEGTPVETVQNVGEDLHGMLTALEINSEYTFSAQPDDEGHFPAGSVHERWTELVITWRGGACDGQDEEDGCGRNVYGFDQVMGAGSEVIEANPEVHLDGLYDLSIAPHSMAFNYGEIMLFAVERLVLPRLMGTDNFEDLLFGMLGGNGCQGAEACCESFGTRASEYIGGSAVAESIAKSACEVGVPAATTAIRNRMRGLSIGEGGERFVLGTYDVDDIEKNTPCRLHMGEGNDIGKLGDNQSEADRCTWYVQMQLGEGEPTELTGRWHGVRQP